MKVLAALTLLVIVVEGTVVPGINDLEGQSKFDYITLTSPVPRFEDLSKRMQGLFLSSYKMCDMNELGYTGQDTVDLSHLYFFNPTETAKRLSFCYLKYLHYLNENAKLQANDLYESLITDICEKVAVRIITDCEGVTGDGNDDTAYNMYQCLMPKIMAARNGFLTKECNAN